MNFLCETHITEVEIASCFGILQLCVLCIVNLTVSFLLDILCWLLSWMKLFLGIMAFTNSKALFALIEYLLLFRIHD